jgi:hypothetical protein
MQQPRATFEYLQASIVQEWDLAKWLACEMVGLATVKRDRSNGIGEPSFLTRPSQP